MYKSILGPEDFPSITICADPGFDDEALVSLGYAASHDFTQGDLEGSTNILR